MTFGEAGSQVRDRVFTVTEPLESALHSHPRGFMSEFAYDQHFVAFFDILGFKDIIAGAVTDEQATEQIDFLNDALLASRTIFAKQWGGEVDEFEVKMFSDCICASVPAKDDNVAGFFQAVTYVQATLARNRIMLRGGVTVGRHYVDDQLIFSEALVEAYKIETTTKHPHIAISQRLQDHVSPPEGVAFGDDAETQLRMKNIAALHHSIGFKLRHDSVMFLDYLNFQTDEHDALAHIREHRDWIIWGLKAHRGNAGVRPKFEWLRRYHNQWCSRYEKHRDNLGELLVDESHV